MTTLLPDDPIFLPEQDQFGRERLGKSLADLVHNAPAGQSMRLGVYGDWGEGKTSVLRLIEYHLKKQDHLCVRLAPWIGKTPEDIWVMLIEQLTDQVAVGAQAFRESQAAARQVSSIRQVASDSHWTLKMLNGVIGARLQKSADALAVTERDDFLNELFNVLGERKVVVFVDDLDRTDPKVIPSLLMSLRDIFNFPNFFFVLALSPKVVAEGLKSIGFGGEQPILFLEKIVELPIYLPALDEHAVDRFISHGISAIASSVRERTLRELIPVLPRNPRRIKLFLRYLASLKGEFGRFGDSEIRWRTLYLTQMLRIEFPEEAQRLSTDAKTLEAIEYFDVQQRTQKIAGIKGENGAPPPETLYQPAEEDRRQRFLAICAAIRESSSFVGHRYSLATMLRIVEEPPVITWEEITRFFNAFSVMDQTSRAALLQHWIGYSGGELLNPERATAAFDLAIELRDAILDHATDATLAVDVVDNVKAAATATDLMRLLALDLETFKDGVLAEESWTRLFNHFLKWSRLFRQREFHQVRRDELVFLKDLAAVTPINTQVKLLGTDVFRASDRVGGEPKAFVQVADAVQSNFANSAVELLLERFTEADGIEGLKNTALGKVGVRFLFTLGSPFHTKRVRARLKQISLRASNDPAVQVNFYIYLRTLTDGAFGENWGSDSLSRIDCQGLLDDRELVRVIWKAAVTGKLNARMTGTLRSYREVLLKRSIQERDVPLPSWWKRLERTFFSQT